VTVSVAGHFVIIFGRGEEGREAIDAEIKVAGGGADNWVENVGV